MQRLSFLISPTSPGFDKLPRAVRKAVCEAMFIPHPAPTPAPTRTQLDLDAANPFIDDSAYYGMNNVEPDFDIDSSAEFQDHDDEYAGLTIVEPGHGNIRRWLKGYDIL